MPVSKSLSTLFVVLGAVTFAPNPALAQSLLIDDFTTGAYQVDAYPAAPDTNYQWGSMLGGVRETYVKAIPGLTQHQRPASLSIPKGGPLILENGYQMFHRLHLYYGLTPLNLDVTGYARIRVWFDGIDLSENFNIQLWSADGARYYQLGVNTHTSALPSCVDFPLDMFNIPAEDRADVDSIRLIFQSASQMGANDFALRSVSFIGPNDVSSASCALPQ